MLAEQIESLATGRGDLRIDSIEERERCQQVLTRAALMPGVLTTRPTGPADRLVQWQSMQPTEQVTHDGELLDALGPDSRRRKQPASDALSDEDGRAVERRHRVVHCEPLSRVVLPLEEPQDSRVAFNPGLRASRRKHTRNPWVAVTAIDAEDVVVMPAGLRRGDGVDAIVIPDMGEQALGGRLMEQPRIEALEIGERFRVALTSVLRVAPDHLLETAVLGHGQASSLHPRPPATRCLEMACDIDDREGNSPSPMEPRLGRTFQRSATGRRRDAIVPDQSRECQVPHETPVSSEGAPMPFAGSERARWQSILARLEHLCFDISRTDTLQSSLVIVGS